ncbi:MULTISPECIES: NADH-dependent [FeFe] hydrogenase, group A6 [unclassified Oceanispirochaeta]|uniref:NADH-dependent [FeFe] hydrogenase, group A6 n=1 Tax=unclassified Oceanispirochaeta TaxID=2635722 RepID=UPI000E098573|nr:NADH-dependent [FeFe] hydrogenase, group A6 [Oceanispirochaeta sp. M1]MBF9015463.1 iron hydrogenase small subunit [Oceanispirochaeta sp. M2]NPD71922.1 4Fe-4S binding protein [Oceanispirochaeta sp. M1]RDG32730.1 ferredoxin [Oceanispirochaeta sp. M1]
METVEIKINGQPYVVEKDTTILKAAKKGGIKIPTLCTHSDLEPWAACGICVVKVEGSPKMVRACATAVVPGQNYITHDPELQKIRKTVVEMTLSNHPQECLTCARNQTCELQQVAAEFGIREIPFPMDVKRLPKDESTASLVFDPTKCIQCGRCAQVCQQLQGVWALEFLHRGHETRIAPAAGALLNESPCIKCGQCSAHCPVGAIYEKDQTAEFCVAVEDESKHVAVQIAPAVRVALGEAFGMAPGSITTGKIYTALRMMGSDVVFDTNFAADLTIMEEGTELVQRITKGTGVLPQITSCCPAWTDYMEKYYPDMIPHFSTAKSPMMMQGAVTKTYYADQAKVKKEDIYSVAIMPCTAKKYEIGRDENMHASGVNDVDLVLTTRELARMIKTAGIDFVNIPDSDADSPIGAYSGAGTIFGVTGGVMEAAVRTAYKLVTDKELDDVNVTAVRGMEGVKKGSVDFDGTEIKVAVAHGMANVKSIMDEIRNANEKGLEPPYHFIEVMACRGGCIAGGGQPYGTEDDIRDKRIAGIYSDDEKSVIRRSHENPEIVKIYKDFLDKPLSHKAHDLLHTTYQERPLYQK